MDKTKLDEIFHPRGVALVGISQSGWSFASGVLEALKKAGYTAIYSVNPKYQEVYGFQCYPSVSAIPHTVDYVVVSIPSQGVLELLEDCGKKGVKSVQFFTAGFSEGGNQAGAELEKAMLQKARSGGFRIIGPNCVGMFVPSARFSLDEDMPMEPGNIAFLAQSGGYAYDLPLYGALRGLRFSKVISYGNAIDIDECELLEYFMEDDDTRFIAAYIEGVRRGREFFNILLKNKGRKPVVLFKGGVTATGLRATYSHTASMTSSVAILNALCRQCNVIQAGNLDELIDVLVILNSAPPLPGGKNTVVMGVGGGPTVMAGDQIEAAGLNLLPLSAAIQKELSILIPPAGSILVNPIDAAVLFMPDIRNKAMRIIGNLPDVDNIVYHMGFHPASRWGRGFYGSENSVQQLVDTIQKVRTETGKPVMLALGPWYDAKGREEMMKVQQALAKANLPFCFSLKDAATAIARVEKWNRMQS